MKSKKQILIIALLIAGGLGHPIMAQAINDVPKNDPAYPAIQKSVKDGYLPLFSDKSFQGQRGVSRKEVAIAIQKLLQEIESSNINLSKTEIDELMQLSKSFKTYLSDIETDKDKDTKTFQSLFEEQKVINHDLTRINDELQQEMRSVKQQQAYLWIGVVAAGILGMLL